MIKEEFNKKKYLIFLFLFSTAYFIYQHLTNISWDFSVYVLNAQYWAGTTSFFELLRPPLMPFIILLLSPLGRIASELIYLFIVSLLFLFSTVKLSKSLKFNPEIFYLFSLTPYVLFYGLINGTELLSLSLLELFIAYLINKKSFSGLFLGLASLSRYNLFIFLPLILISKRIKNISINILFFILPFIPWFIYNYYKTGNFFSSIIDNYALNIKFRDYFLSQFNINHFAFIILFLLPFFIYGIYIAIKKKGVNNLIFSAVLILTIFQYIKTPSSEIRYLFILALPVSYFSYLGFIKFTKTYKSTLQPLLVFIIFSTILTLTYLDLEYEHENTQVYKNAISSLNELNISDCNLYSNSWPFLNYFGKSSDKMPSRIQIPSLIEKGDYILYFNEEEYFSKDSFPIIYENNDFILLGKSNSCNKINKLDKTYLESINELTKNFYGYEINTNPCFVLFDNISLLEKTCNLINFKGFTLDKDRNRA